MAGVAVMFEHSAEENWHSFGLALRVVCGDEGQIDVPVTHNASLKPRLAVSEDCLRYPCRLQETCRQYTVVIASVRSYAHLLLLCCTVYKSKQREYVQVCMVHRLPPSRERKGGDQETCPGQLS